MIPGATTVPELDAYLATPTGEGPWPGVVVLHEAFGLTDDTRAQADRLAAAGYLAVAPNLFTAGGVRCLRSTFAAMLSGHGPAFGDIDATRRWLAGRADCTGRVGVIGFCLGGGFALGAASGGFAAAPNYGRLPKDARALLAGACPVVASYGGRDMTLRGAAGALDTLLTELGVTHDVKEYPDANHSFLNQESGRVASVMKFAGLGYHEPSAADAWSRILAWFAPAANAAVRADCIVGITSNQAPSLACRVLSGGEARGRADCIFAPDVYTRWISSPGGAQGGRCAFDARGAILETRSF